MQKLPTLFFYLAIASCLCCAGCDAKPGKVIRPIDRFQSAEELAAYEQSFNEAAEAAKSGDE